MGLTGLVPKEKSQRTLMTATFVNTFGSGLFMASSALYFTRVVGLPTAQVAFGLGAGALVGLAAGIFAGRLADRMGARETQAVVMLCGAVAMTSFAFVRSLAAFLLVCCLAGVVFAADKASWAPLVRAIGGADQVVFRAYLRSVTNLAIALGALVAGVGVQIDSPPGYVALMIGRALAYVGCAVIILRLPRPAMRSRPVERQRWLALRDRKYLAATTLNGLFSMHFAVLTFALPLWVVNDTAAPRAAVSGALLLNTAMVVVLQVRVSRGVTDPESAGRRMRWAGAALLVGLALLALAAAGSAVVAVLLLAAGTGVYTLGELWHAAAAMEYSFGLAPAHAQGQYYGVFGLGQGVATAFAPAVLGTVALGWGWPGWMLLGAVFLVLGALNGPVIRLATPAGTPAVIGLEPQVERTAS